MTGEHVAYNTLLQSRGPLALTRRLLPQLTVTPPHAYSVVGYLNKDENIPVFIPRIGNPSEFREKRRDPSCAQGTSNGSSREIYPKLYVNSITVINTGENHVLSRCARVAYEYIRNNLFM